MTFCNSDEKTGTMSPFVHAKQNAKPDCSKCKGTGSYMYDHNHGTICDLCCTHGEPEDWWQLSECHGVDRAGFWCCGLGCGVTRKDKPE